MPKVKHYQAIANMRERYDNHIHWLEQGLKTPTSDMSEDEKREIRLGSANIIATLHQFVGKYDDIEETERKSEENFKTFKQEIEKGILPALQEEREALHYLISLVLLPEEDITRPKNVVFIRAMKRYERYILKGILGGKTRMEGTLHPIYRLFEKELDACETYIQRFSDEVPWVQNLPAIIGSFNNTHPARTKL